MFVPSPRQSAIFDAAHTPDHLLIQACAGSGKTTTLVELTKQYPTSVSILALAFNKSIATELQNRMPRHVQSKTMHSVGMSAVTKNLGRISLDDKKLRRICETIALHEVSSKDVESVVSDLLAAVPLTMECMLDPTDIDRIMGHCASCGRSLDLPDTSVPLISRVIEENDKCENVMSFTDMLRWPIVKGFALPRFDVVLVDEAQDLNAVQHEFLKRVVRRKLIAVGDRAQAIYGFRGADPKSMDRLKSDWDMTELPLDVSYRCPQKVVALAKEVVGELIQPHQNAEEGEVVHVDDQHKHETQEALYPGCMVICRNNAPLVPWAFSLIRRGKKAVVRGRDIGAGLASLVRRSKATTVGDVLAFSRERMEADVLKAMKSDKPVEPIQDRHDTLCAIAAECSTVAEILMRIDTIFSEDVAGIVLSTVHKAKGLEADTVVILGPEILPAPWAKSDEARAQEMNLRYVAVTRAKRTLIMQALPKRGED